MHSGSVWVAGTELKNNSKTLDASAFDFTEVDCDGIENKQDSLDCYRTHSGATEVPIGQTAEYLLLGAKLGNDADALLW